MLLSELLPVIYFFVIIGVHSLFIFSAGRLKILSNKRPPVPHLISCCSLLLSALRTHQHQCTALLFSPKIFRILVAIIWSHAVISLSITYQLLFLHHLIELRNVTTAFLSITLHLSSVFIRSVGTTDKA